MQKITEPQIRLLKIIMAVILLASMFFIAREGAVCVSNMQLQEKEKEQNAGEICVVIDAGHGGSDPGKVGINGALEKEINLLIAKKLQKILEAQNIKTVMTRTEDAGLYEENISNKKVQDMKHRVEIIEQSGCVLVVSIHQNSYQQEEIQGSQVFYYTGSQEGRKLAELIQASLIKRVDRDGTRVAKGNDDYYLLRKTSVPIVIVECGFLSNYTEAQQLISDAYQEKTAWAIHMGILQYLRNYNCIRSGDNV